MKSLEELKANLPEEGLFRDEELPFLLSPEPLRLEAKLIRQLERLGPVLFKFQMACDRLYKRSKKGTITPWLAEVLDAGKPEWMVDEQYQGIHRNALPRVIRPDLLLTEEGFALSELDSVPGGMGITAWLTTQYADVLGGASGMVDGFRSIAPEGLSVQISEESADYRPEMQWLVEQIGEGWSCESAEESAGADGDVYRFFELFDWENIANIKSHFLRNEVAPPLKPHLEEKLWLALFHTPSLRPLWEEELRAKQITTLQKLIPYGWVMDPIPLPPQASFPKLHAHRWDEVANWSQKERQLVLKISGFSEDAWGSRGVTIGHDCSKIEWQDAMQKALVSYEEGPYIMQRFAETKLVDHPYYAADTGELKTMRGRVRLCPYYFVTPDYKRVTLGGVLATINPADKKKIHGMRDGILTVVALDGES